MARAEAGIVTKYGVTYEVVKIRQYTLLRNEEFYKNLSVKLSNGEELSIDMELEGEDMFHNKVVYYSAWLKNKAGKFSQAGEFEYADAWEWTYAEQHAKELAQKIVNDITRRNYESARNNK